MKCNAHAAAVLTNLGVVILVGLAVYLTRSPWPLLGLIFLSSSSSGSIQTKCPKCGHAFTAVHEKTENDDCGEAEEPRS